MGFEGTNELFMREVGAAFWGFLSGLWGIFPSSLFFLLFSILTFHRQAGVEGLIQRMEGETDSDQCWG